MKPVLLLAAALLTHVALAQGPDPAAASMPTADPIAAARFTPAYPVPYEPASEAQIKAALDRVLSYLEGASRLTIIDRATNQPVADPDHLPPKAGLARTDFLLTSYEWGVTYAGMLHVAAVTADQRYRRYVADRLLPIARLAAHLDQQPAEPPALTPRERMQALLPVRHPRSLDDSGSMAAAMIKASRAGIDSQQLRPCIDRYLDWISHRQDRLPDGTLVRQRPQPSTLWLDDLYMSVPALAQMGALTGSPTYWDDAVKQIVQFSSRMFVPETGLYRHGWVQGMEPHPAFLWARANGWAIVAMTELLEVLPAEHPGRAAVLAQYRAHIAGLARVQSGEGLWHQLLDRPDSYQETSASAMFVYAIAHGIDRGWLNAAAYGPVASLGWNAVARRINPQGQVEGTCVGTGMGFDPMFYFYRPTSVLAAHGYGPVLLAGAEMIRLERGNHRGRIHDNAIQFSVPPASPRNSTQP